MYLLIELLLGSPTLNVNNDSRVDITANMSVYMEPLIMTNQSQLTCNSSLVFSNTTTYTWFYCYGSLTETMMVNDSATLYLDSTSLVEGPYSCVVPGDGVTTIYICTGNSKD